MRRILSIGYLIHGLWIGWIGVLLLARSGNIAFEVVPPRLGITNYCYVNGYPKQEDYFWYGLMIVVGWLGVLANRLILSIFHESIHNNNRNIGFGIIGITCVIFTTLLGFTDRYAGWPGIFLLYLGGILLPHFFFAWINQKDKYLRERTDITNGPVSLLIWILFSASVSVLWVYDSCYKNGVIDGVHEGGILLYIQSWLMGDRPGLEVKIQYGPLYVYSLGYWMKFIGMNIAAERLYYMAVQIAGTTVNLVLLRLAGIRLPFLLIGALLILVHSTATGIGYGWANSLRAALPLLGLWFYWMSLKNKRYTGIFISGFIIASSLLYSPEYGMAVLISCAALFLFESPGLTRSVAVKTTLILTFRTSRTRYRAKDPVSFVE